MTLLRLNILAVALTLLAIVFIALNAEAGGRIFWHLLTVQDLPAAWLMLALLVSSYLLAIRYRFGENLLSEFLLRVERGRYMMALCLWVSLCAGTIWFSRNHPLSMDEYSYLFQAKIFAAGAIRGQLPPDLIDQLVPRGFQGQFIMVNRFDGAVMSAYWPGFSLLLAPFVWLGVPWACNPTIVAGSFLLIGRFTRDLTGSRLEAGWALLFALASPAFVANGITYYSMSAHLLLNLAFAWLLLSPSSGRLFVAGLAGGYALSLHNPFPHAVFAAPWIVWLVSQKGQRLRNIACLAAGYMPVVATMFLGWVVLRQDVIAAIPAGGGAHQLVPGIEQPWIGQRTAEFLWRLTRFLRLPDEWTVYARVGGLAKLWLWASPLLLLLAWQGARKETSTPIRLLVASGLVTFFAYFAIPFDQGHGWGYRYFHPAWWILPVLAAAGVRKLDVSVGTPRESALGKTQIIALTLSGGLLLNGLRTAQIDSFLGNHLNQRTPVHDAAFQIHFQNGGGLYSRDLVQNDPWLRTGELFMDENDVARQHEIARRFMPQGYSIDQNGHGTTYFR